MTILATIIVLGVLIFVHELGHFWAAKSVGIGVERFSIGLGPKIFGFTRGETEYVLSAIPLGGYVKMQGMEDEIMEAIEGGNDGEPRVPSERDYDQKPVWARAIVISAGVIMNMLFAFAAFAFTAGVWGFQEQNTTRVGAIRGELIPAGGEALAGVQVGATVLSVGGEPVAHWGEVRDGIWNAAPGPLTIETANPAATVEVQIPEEEELRRRMAAAMTFWSDPDIGAVNPGTPAEDAGIEAGDRVLRVEGREIRTWAEFVAAVQVRPDTRTELTLLRDGREITRFVTPEPTRGLDPVTGEEVVRGTVGVSMPFEADDIVFTPMNWGDAIVYGWDRTWVITGEIFGFLRDLVTGGVSARSMGSIFTIGEASGRAAEMGVQAFLGFMGLFSINLAVLNMLPIPVLDGGHLVFLTLEAVRGKPVSVQQRLRWSNIGFIVIMLIMVWALGNDLLRIFGF